MISALLKLTLDGDPVANSFELELVVFVTLLVLADPAAWFVELEFAVMVVVAFLI